MDKYLIIGNDMVSLQRVDRRSLKGVWLDAVARYSFWKGVFRNEEWLVLELKAGAEAYTPVQCAALTGRLKEGGAVRVVFYFDALDFNKRERMMAQGVYFVVGRKYAFLPGVLINGRGKAKEKTGELTAVGQYLLLFHLQVRSLEGLSAREMGELLPYRYVTITLAMQVLTDLDICVIRVGDDKTRRLHFVAEGRELFERVEPLLMNPVKKGFYCDEVRGVFAVAGINALSRYSMLAPEKLHTVAVEEKRVSLKSKDCPFVGMNAWDGPFRVEIWKYPPIVKDGVVDRLSLALSLRMDEDPRIQKELKQMIEGLW